MPSAADSCSRSASENADTGMLPAAAATCLTRSMAAARVAGVPDMQISPAPAGIAMGAPGSTAIDATRTNVVRVPWRARRASSATMPMLMMS